LEHGRPNGLYQFKSKKPKIVVKPNDICGLRRLRIFSTGH
jgi:hypothetical protein